MIVDDNDLLSLGRRGQLASNITFLMLKGAGWALFWVFLIWLAYAVIAAVGRTLPEASRATPDPAPVAFIEMTAPAADDGM